MWAHSWLGINPEFVLEDHIEQLVVDHLSFGEALLFLGAQGRIRSGMAVLDAKFDAAYGGQRPVYPILDRWRRMSLTAWRKMLDYYHVWASCSYTAHTAYLLPTWNIWMCRATMLLHHESHVPHRKEDEMRDTVLFAALLFAHLSMRPRQDANVPNVTLPHCRIRDVSEWEPHACSEYWLLQMPAYAVGLAKLIGGWRYEALGIMSDVPFSLVQQEESRVWRKLFGLAKLPMIYRLPESLIYD